MKRTLAIALLWAGCVHGQDAPIVRVNVDPDTVMVGESAELTVTVLVPTWFPQPPVYPNFELANAITRLPSDRSRPTSERIGRTTWSGIVRVYEIYPLTAATYRIGGESIGVTWANPGSDPFRQELEVPDIELRARVPAGAQGLDPWIAGTRLSLRIEPEGGLEDLEAGDAVVLRYTAELDGLPAIFLPPLARLDVDGASVYADAPEITDGPPARRSEKVTIVFDTGGEFTVPGVSLDYWKTDVGRIETVTADGFSLSVAGPPAEAPADTDEPTSIDWRWIFIVGAFAIGAAAFIRRRWPQWRDAREQMRRRREASEDHAFRELLAALRTDQTIRAYRWLLEWIHRLDPALDSHEFARCYGDETLQAMLEQWRADLFAGAPGGSDPEAIALGLEQARQCYRSRLPRVTRTGLPPLNPA
jgi:hypothetical protein